MIPFVMVTLDKPRKLQLSFGAMIEYEQLTGLKIADIDNEIPLADVPKMTWVLLRGEDPSLTLEQACDLITNYAESYTDIVTKTVAMIRGAFAGVKKNSKNA